MRYIFYALTLAALPLLAACEPSIEEEARDVDQAKQEAAENVGEAAKDVEAERREANAEITREQRDLEDTAKREADKIEQERRELEDAKKDPDRPVSDNPPDR
jgi:hypothetical protein